MTRSGRKTPVVGVPASVKRIDGLPYHSAGDKYLRAVRDLSGALPLVLPAMDKPLVPTDILPLVDGLLFTGSPSNVHPAAYGATVDTQGDDLDPGRDALALPLLRAAIDAGVPVFAICRGFQELNVACGGTLHRRLHEVEGRRDHREDFSAPEEVRYGPAHEVSVMPGGLLAELTGAERFTVNSLHGQGVDRLGEGLAVEATAADGTIEAVSYPGGRAFCLGVQWHPEWRAEASPISRALFAAFGKALRAE